MLPTHRGIEIVGGGLAGLSLGLALRREGVTVVLHEAGVYPRHRVCGEFISGLGDGTIARLGLAPILADAHRHRTVTWFKGAAPVATQTLPAPALGLSRNILDARLAAAFSEAGGILHTHSRVDCTGAPEGRVLSTGRRRGGSGWLGLKVHVRGLALAGDLEVHLGRRAYVGLCPVEDGAVNLCGFFHRRNAPASAAPPAGRRSALLPACLAAAGLDVLEKRIQDAAVDEASFCAVAAVDFRTAPAERDRLRLGDAFAMTPPFTGNGMAMAFQSAELALDPLLAWARGEVAWTAACRTADALVRRRFRPRLAAANGLHSFLLRPGLQGGLAAAASAGLLPLHLLYRITH